MNPLQSAPTPSLDGLLARFGRRLRGQVWTYGLGRTATVLAGWLVFMFLVDWLLHVPPGVRLFHLGVLVALPAFVVARELVARLRRVPDRDGLAVLVERAHPELHELFVSAVQLGARGAREGEDPELVARVVAEAEARAAATDLEGTVDARAPRRALALGAAAALVAAGLLGSVGEARSIFFARIAGGATPWPQRTRLAVEIPVVGGRAQVEVAEDQIHVRVARGSDVPVVVRAEGVTPDEVTLHFASGRNTTLPAGSGATFRGLLRAVQDDTRFYATGGDDRDQRPLVTVEVLQPPDVAGVALVTEPPAYTGLAGVQVFDRDVQVVAGTRVRVHVLPDPPEARGVARLLPEDRTVQLVEAPFPHRPEAGGDGAAAAEPLPGLAFELAVEADLRYRFELTDDTGLANPDPGLFAIDVVEDRPPEVELLSPGRLEIETVIGGLLPLRARALDDFGVTGLRLETSRPGGDEAPRTSALTLRPIEVPERDSARHRAAAFASRRLSVDELAGGDPVVEGELFELELVALDVREPVALEGRSLPMRVRVVSPDEFLRRIQDGLSRARVDVAALAERISERHRDTLELVSALESDQPGDAFDAGELGAAVSGMRRVQGDARALARDLSGLAEALLWSRLDERSEALLAELDRQTAELVERGFQPEIWRALARLEAGAALGGTAFASKLVQIVGLALEISEDEAVAAAEALRAAEVAGELTAVQDALLDAVDRQAAAQAKAERLLELLAEWDNFQSVLSLTREIINRQKNLLERARQHAKEN